MRDARVAMVPVVFLLLGTLTHDAGAAAVVTIVRQFTPAHRVSGRYQYVPFEVPPGTGTLRISYQYDRANGENIVDLGLFEPGPLDLGTPAFRGYSGGSKSGLTISAAATTPGYRPGPLPPGRWHVLLGLYKVRDAGVEVTITVETEAGPPPATPPAVSPREPAAPGRARWYAGALHTHTLHSDGTLGPAELIRLVRDAGFDFVAITDHNNTTHRYELGLRPADNAPAPSAVRERAARGAERSPLWIVGEEVTTPSGHASVWGLGDGGWVDFRVSAGERRVGELVAAARRHGALFSINHPVSQCVGCGWAHEIVDGIEGIEISNGRHGEVEEALAIWDKLLRAGRRITGVGSSDWHAAPNPIDVANVRVYATSLTTNGILGAIRSGRVIVMRNARDATPDIVVRSGGQVARIGESLKVARGSSMTIEVNAPGFAGGRLVPVSNGERATPVVLDARAEARVDTPVDAGYLRFELYAPDGMAVAITNPIYLVLK